jgi:iron complex outermembrane recepter protein
MKLWRRLSICMLTGAGALAAGTTALAQATAGAEAKAAGADETLGEVTVTGSRVIQNGNDMPTPVTIVAPEQLLQTKPGNVIDAIEQLPSLVGSQGPATSQPGNPSGNTAAHTLNLRNLGTTRTLVLFDGRRLPPTTFDGSVVVDIVPSLLLERVDLVTGGASAVYGSDAVAGVVNFITSRNFNGYKVNLQKGVSKYNDGRELRMGAAAGTTLGSGLHIEGSYEYYKNDGILSKLSREWGRNVWTVQGAGTAANPYRLVQNTRINLYTIGGNITSGPLNGLVFHQNGIATPFVHGTATGSPAAESGGDGFFFARPSLAGALESHQAFGRADYDFANGVHGYAEIVAMQARNETAFSGNIITTGVRLGNNNAFLPLQYQTGLPPVTTGIPAAESFGISKFFDQSRASNPTTITRSYVANLGLEGSLGQWKWDAAYVHTDNDATTWTDGNVDANRLLAALDAVFDPTDPTGRRVVCNVTITNPGLYPGCLPLNVFGPTSSDQAALDWVGVHTQFQTKTKMDNFSAGLRGEPFSTWAGPVSTAVSTEWRKLSYEVISNADPAERANCTGVRFNNCVPRSATSAGTARWRSNVIANATGSQSVAEGALEGNAPLIKDAAFAKELSLNGAVRYTHYSTSGNATTWKAGLVWHLNDQVTFRGTRSRDIRAPNLNELFAPPLINPASLTDVHTGLSRASFVTTTSNPDLQPEVAETWTAGMVLQPGFLPRFSLSIDWYRLNIDNAVVSLSGATTTIQNICEASGGTSPLCSLMVRPLPFSDRTAANFPTNFLSQPVNAQKQDTNGLDVEASYKAPIAGGNLDLRALVSYQPHLRVVATPGAPVLDSADVPPVAKTRVMLFAKYEKGNVSVDVTERWRSSFAWNADPTLVYDIPRVPSAAYTNMTVSYRLNQAQLYFAVENVFDKQPDPFANAGGASGVPGLLGGYALGDDVIGRYFTLGLRARFGK